MLPALVIYTLVPFFIWKKTTPISGTPKQRFLLSIIFLFIISWPVFNGVVIKNDNINHAITKQMN